MTKEQKIEYLKIALSLQGIHTDTQTSDAILQTIDKIIELKGDFSIKHAVEIKTNVTKKYKQSD